MIAPCRKCGSVKIGPLRPNFVRAVAKLFGLRLNACAQCGRWLMVPQREMKGRHRRDSQTPHLEMLKTGSPASPRETPVEVLQPKRRDSSRAVCPECGSQE